MARPLRDEARIPTSTLLEGLLQDAPDDRLTLDWLLDRLGERSFGIVLLLLSLLAMLPGMSVLIGMLTPLLAVQMIMARRGPAFPRRIASRSIPTARLARLITRLVPPLRWLERYVRPRWVTPFEATKRFVGVLILLLGVLLFAPVPFSNVPVAFAILLLAVSYVEEDGVLLCLSLAVALVLLGSAALAVWQTVRVTGL
jgi:hypothetical protein